MTASGNSLQKTAGCGGCPDASAVSQQRVAASAGRLQFTATEANSLRFIGLSLGSTGTQAGDLSFALRLQNGTVEVRESGSYKSETSFQGGDTLGILIENGTAKYVKNGSVFYTSANQAPDGQRVHAIFFDMDARVGDIAIGAASNLAPSAASTVSSQFARPPSLPSIGKAKPRG